MMWSRSAAAGRFETWLNGMEEPTRGLTAVDGQRNRYQTTGPATLPVAHDTRERPLLGPIEADFKCLSAFNWLVGTLHAPAMLSIKNCPRTLTIVCYAASRGHERVVFKGWRALGAGGTWEGSDVEISF